MTYISGISRMLILKNSPSLFCPGNFPLTLNVPTNILIISFDTNSEDLKLIITNGLLWDTVALIVQKQYHALDFVWI